MARRAMIFDLDGTLVDTNAAHVEAWHEAFAVHGHDVPTERIVAEVGKGGDQLVPAIVGPEGERTQGEGLRRVHGEAFERIARQRTFHVFPGVRELLAELRRRGLRVALATSSKLEHVSIIERSAGIDLRSLVDLSVTASEANASKPAPDLVVATLRKLDLPPGRCLFVGDTIYDVQAARQAGVDCLALLCGGCSSAEALRAAGAKAIWRDPADLLTHLDAGLAA